MNLATFAAARKRPRHPAHTPGPAPAPDPRATLRRLLPLPLVEISTVLGAIGVPRHAAQEALNAALRAGEVWLTHGGNGVLVVATGDAR